MKFLFILSMFLLASINVSGQTATVTKEKCTATTTKGVQCKNAAIAGQKTCSIHAANAIQCGATTTKGLPCKMRVKVAGEKCWRHKQ